MTELDVVAAWVRAINERDFGALDTLMAATYVNHHRAYAQDDGVPGVKRFFQALCASIDGFTYEVIALDHDGPGGMVRLVLRGAGRLVTPFAGATCVGERVRVSVTHRYRVADDRIAERWGDPADPFRVEPASAVT